MLDRDHEAYKTKARTGDRFASDYRKLAKQLPVRSRSGHAIGGPGERNYTGPERELNRIKSDTHSNR